MKWKKTSWSEPTCANIRANEAAYYCSALNWISNVQHFAHNFHSHEAASCEEWERKSSISHINLNIFQLHSAVMPGKSVSLFDDILSVINALFAFFSLPASLSCFFLVIYAFLLTHSLARLLAKENEMFVLIWFKFLKHSINFHWSRDVYAWNDNIQMHTSSRDLHLISDAREDFMTWHYSLHKGLKFVIFTGINFI